jgi:hypothetical protein
VTFGRELVVLHTTPSMFVWYIKVYAWKYILYQFIEGQTHLACNQEDFGPPLSRIRLLFIQIQRLPPSMHHHEWKEIIDSVCKTTNGKIIGDQLPTESLIVLEENSNVTSGSTKINVYNGNFLRTDSKP